MARTRRSSMEIIEDKIHIAQEDVAKKKEQYDAACKSLKTLLDKRDAMRKDEIMAAVAKSDYSFEEIMEFLTKHRNRDSEDL